MSRIYYINAHKMVRLCQVEVEAENEEMAIEAYLNMAHRGDVDIDSYNWQNLSSGDLDVEDHGEGKDEPF